MEERQYDLVVIGAGPGGYEAALHAAGLGLTTALVEERQLGGTCLNRGCIPTKTLLHAAELYEETKKMNLFGLSADNVYFDIERMHERTDDVLFKLRGGIAALLSKAKVSVFEGRGYVAGPGRVAVIPAKAMEEVVLGAKNILIATGASPRKPPIPGAGGDGVYTSDELLSERKRMLERLIIVGGGVIGCEFATVYNALGSQVVILEAENRILPLMDKEISQSLSMSLKKKGVEIHTGAKVTEILEGLGERDMHCRYTVKEKKTETTETAEKAEKAEKVSGDCVLISIGRAPNTKELFADGLTAEGPTPDGPTPDGPTPEAENMEGGVTAGKVLLNRGFIQVNHRFETGLPGVYAIGDVIGGIQLAHVATAEGTSAVEYIAGVPQSKNLRVVPSCIYTKPEIASVGMTVEEAKEKGIAVKSSKYSMLANGKSIIEEQERGFVKVICREADGVIVGAQLMCARATDLVAELSLAISAGLTRKQVNEVIHPHPTFSEGIGEAVKG